MKLMIASDLHGSLYYTNKMLAAFDESHADYLILLGDLMYHGPRNGLPNDYQPSKVAERLNEYKNKIIAVRGNCDAEIDQMLLSFPMLGSEASILFNGHRIFLTHGHVYNDMHLPNLCEGDYLFFGHTHCSMLKEINGITVMNPGSVSFPKDGQNSFAIMDEEKIIIYPL